MRIKLNLYALLLSLFLELLISDISNFYVTIALHNIIDDCISYKYSVLRRTLIYYSTILNVLLCDRTNRFHRYCVYLKKKINMTSKMVLVQLIFLVIFTPQFYNNVECISFFHFTQDPPPVKDIALMSRYIVHHSGNITE